MSQKLKKTIKEEKLTKGQRDDLDYLVSNCSLAIRKSVRALDRKLLVRSRELAKRLTRLLSEASPKSTQDLISGVAVDLADFWQIGKEHEQRLKLLASMTFPKDSKLLLGLLYDLEVRLVWHSEWHTRRLKKSLTKLKRDLENRGQEHVKR